MIQPSKADSQIVLYAKGRFRDHHDPETDLRALVAYRADMNPEHITQRDVVAVLLILMATLKIDLYETRVLEIIIFGSYMGPSQSAYQNFLVAFVTAVRHVPVKNDTEVLIHLEPLDLSVLN